MGSLLTDSGLKAIVQLFPRLQSLRIAQSHIRGITCDEPVSPPQNLAKLDVSGCTLMHSLPQTIVPPVLQKVPSDRYSLSGLRILLIGRCEQLDLSELLSQIEGHPICRLDGLITIPSLDGVLLQRVFSSGFPLSEVSLTGCNFDWFRGNPSILADFLCEWLPTDTLTQLSLPLRPVQSTQDADARVRICTGLSRLGQCKKLVDLDLGGQIVGQQEFDSILNALQSLPHLNRLCVTDLPLGTQQALCNACPTHCKIRVHQHRRP
ncbi:hypothetical protein D915_008734 [Fasciola hepatica]|uniref:Leucine Rich repeat-containing domain protein n=1 Tax=Fasciola hepatica TaxID=6192 RepID=A0A4E0RG08_FASHE|nr:hypothetical protein D915_008734 [Fasciola hepatica]